MYSKQQTHSYTQTPSENSSCNQKSNLPDQISTIWIQITPII